MSKIQKVKISKRSLFKSLSSMGRRQRIIALSGIVLATGLLGYGGYWVYASNNLKAKAETPCLQWTNQIPLQDAINANACTEIQPGTYNVPKPVIIPSRAAGTIVKGKAGMRESTVLVAAAPWQVTIGDGILNVLPTSGTLTVNGITFDSNNVATYSLVARNMNVDNVVMKNGTCSALGITGKGVTVTNSVIEKSGFKCGITGGVPVGAGIYGEVSPNTDGTFDRFLNPVIKNNLIQDNFGPGMDINGVWGGTFTGNTVRNNTDWAGVSLYGASYWTVADNTISHPATSSYQKYHPYCAGGPIGKKSAAIFLCQDTEAYNQLSNYNTFSNNKASSSYGILVIGADEIKKWYAPRINTFTGNDMTGSYFGCADDLKIGQWYNDKNTWSGNKCGSKDGQPTRF